MNPVMLLNACGAPRGRPEPFGPQEGAESSLSGLDSAALGWRQPWQVTPVLLRGLA